MANTDTPKKRPTHKAYAILDRGEGKKAFWTEIGSTWENQDGSLNLDLELVPNKPGTTIQLRPADEHQDRS